VARVHAQIAEMCEEAGMPFRPPAHVPNSRRALETAEVVRARDPDAFAGLDAALFAAHFVEGADIGDPDVLDHLVAAVGLPPGDVRTLVDRGDGREPGATWWARAHDHGIAATPAWLFGEDLVLPGAQPRELFERIVTRLRARGG
jgi:predicted DsbA family dithiol-disulfide isomerase